MHDMHFFMRKTICKIKEKLLIYFKFLYHILINLNSQNIDTIINNFFRYDRLGSLTHVEVSVD